MTKKMNGVENTRSFKKKRNMKKIGKYSNVANGIYNKSWYRQDFAMSSKFRANNMEIHSNISVATVKMLILRIE